MSTKERPNNERNQFITNLLLPSQSIDIYSDDDDAPTHHHRTSSNAISVCQCVATPTYNEFHAMTTIQHSDGENGDLSPFNVPDIETPPPENSNYMEHRKRSLNLNIDIHCPPLPSSSSIPIPSISRTHTPISSDPIHKTQKRKQHSTLSDLQLVFEESRSICNEDNIGDLGNLSDFSDTANTNLYGPYRAKEELQFVDVDDCDVMNDSSIDLLSHIHIDIPYAAINILCNDRHNPYIEDDYDDAYDDGDEDEEDICIHTATPKRVSLFRPNTFDICLMTSSPFSISKNKALASSHMEYLQHSLPNRLEMADTVRQTLIDGECAIRFAHFNGTRSAIESIVSKGGCKILQFVAYCCNPARDCDEYPEICSCLKENEDRDYILLESDDDTCAGVGVWHTAEELSQILDASRTRIDVIICISPQHQRMSKIFESFGYEYIIGIESPSNQCSFASTETMTFLTNLYGGLLDKTSVSHAFDLSLQAALSFRSGSHIKSANCDRKYILNKASCIHHERYVVFNNSNSAAYAADIESSHKLLYDLSQYIELPQTNIRDIIRPMIGRSQYIASLIHNMAQMPLINVTGREFIGKATVVKCAVRYLLELGLFRGGCFVIDCKAKKYQNMSFTHCVFEVMRSCGVFSASDTIDNLPSESICFVILNTSEWHNGSRDISKWIDEYHTELFKNTETRIVCTGATPLHHIQSMDTLTMRALSELSRSELASLFQRFCGHILNEDITEKEIEMNDALQQILKGSPGMTQKVAQFAIWLASGEKNAALSLEQIACDFNAKYCKMRGNNLKLSSQSQSEPFYCDAQNAAHDCKRNELQSESQSLCLRHDHKQAPPEPEPYALIDCPASRSLPNPISVPHPHNIQHTHTYNTHTHVMNKSMEFAKNRAFDLHLLAPSNRHASLADEVWYKSMRDWNNNNNSHRMRLDDLYPNLMQCFKQWTSKLNTNERMPTLAEIECFLIKNGGVKENSNTHAYIEYNDFVNRFFLWFSSMCDMISDLHCIYEANTPLFYSRNVAKEKIADCAVGTFIVRFASQPNGLAITYKKVNGKIFNVLLKRLSHGIYRVGKTDKRTDLFNLLNSWAKLAYLYISDECQMSKDDVIKSMNHHNVNHSHTSNKQAHHHKHGISMSCSLSMTQSTTQKSEDFYAEIEDINDISHNTVKLTNDQITTNELDEIVMNFSDFTHNYDVNNNNDDALRIKCRELNEENMDLKKEMRKCEEENEKLKAQLLVSHHNPYSHPHAQCPQYSPHSPSSQCCSNATPTLSIATCTPTKSKSGCSTPISPFDIKQYVYNINAYVNQQSATLAACDKMLLLKQHQ